VTSFCRHRRLEATCPICSKQRAREAKDAARPARPPRPAPARGSARRGSGARRRSGGGDVRVRHLARAADDGYHSDLAPGLHASADAALLAEEVACAAGRLTRLEAGAGAGGVHGEAAGLPSREEGLWLCFQTAVLGAPPVERVTWAGGALPDTAAVELGPRGVADAASAGAALEAYRAWALRAGGQAAALAGEPAWSPERRFDRAFERLALPGLGRAQRYDFLVTAGALGLADVRPASLHLLADPRDPALLAAKRVFGIGDPLIVARRAGELAAAAAVPVAALDLGLVNWGRRTDDPQAPRITAGGPGEPDPDVLGLLRAALGLE
jgi:hypothetical protein